MGNINSNIWKMYILQVLHWFLLIIPIIVLFFQENGLTFKEILLLQSIFSIAIILFEIPSGYFSDVIGRKTSIIIGVTLGFLGMVIYSISYNFTGFLIAEITIGLGSSFISGTDSALIYDTLVETGKVNDYKKIEGKRMSIGNFSEAIASLIGGFLALTSLRTPFYIESFILFFTIPLAFTLKEPKRHKHENKDGPFKEIIKIVKYSLHQHAEIKWLIFYSGFIGASTLTIVWFIQPYLNFIGLDLVYFGLVWALLNFSVGIFSMYSHKFEGLFGRRISLISLIILAFLGYIIMGSMKSLWAIPFIFIFYFVRGISNPILKDYVNRIITSNMRATVLSVKNLVGRFIFAIVGPFIGWLADIYTFKTAFYFSGSIFLILGIISLLFLKKHKVL